MLDDMWLREFGDLEPSGNVNYWSPVALFFITHAKIRIGIELALRGYMAEARSTLRDGGKLTRNLS